MALVVVTVFQYTIGFDDVRTIGSAFGGIPQGLPEFSMPSITFSQMLSLIGPAFAIAMLGAIESLLSAVVADGMTGTKHNSNQELVGQGMANIIAPLFGALQQQALSLVPPPMCVMAAIARYPESSTL